MFDETQLTKEENENKDLNFEGKFKEIIEKFDLFFVLHFQLSSIMKGIKKQNLPSKICVVCNRPFTWRKKWEKVWDEVKYCSQKCKTSF